MLKNSRGLLIVHTDFHLSFSLYFSRSGAPFSLYHLVVFSGKKRLEKVALTQQYHGGSADFSRSGTSLETELLLLSIV